MDSDRAHELFDLYGASMAYVAVELPNGDQSIGSAFHVGEGAFVTARHVIEGNRIIEVATTQHVYIPLEGEEAASATTFLGSDRTPVHRVESGSLTIASGPHCAKDPDVDLAVFAVDPIDPRTPAVPLGDHLDDWVGQSDFVLSEAIILGYPPIPFADGPLLVGARAEVNAIVDRRDVPYVHLLLSSMPRGGFSGGLVLSEFGMALGIVTHSLLVNNQPVELGYMTALTVEPIYNCLAEYKLLPAAQSEGWEGLWNSQTTDFVGEKTNDFQRPSISGYLHAGWVEIFNDGRSYYVKIGVDDELLHLLDSALEVVRRALPYSLRRDDSRTGIAKVCVSDVDSNIEERLGAARRAVVGVFTAAGYNMH